MQANTAIHFYMRLSELIANRLPGYELSGEVEADESYFGGIRKSKRGRGAAGKIAVFGLLKRSGKVYTPSFLTPKPRRFCRSLKRRFNPTMWCTLTPSSRIMHWT